MLTLVDDFSHASWIYLLQHKSLTITVFTSFIHMVQTQFDTKIRSIRTDNVSEFLSISFQTLLNNHGIALENLFLYTLTEWSGRKEDLTLTSTFQVLNDASFHA